MKLARLSSSGSCYSASQSVVSNASSTKTHRRSSVEVSSFFYSPRSERTTECTDCAKDKLSAAPSFGRQVTAESYSSHSSERRGPGSDRNLSSSSCSRVNASFDTLESSNKSSGSKPRPPGVKVAPAFRAVELIRELSFESAPTTRGTSGPFDPNSTPCAEKLASLSNNHNGVFNYDDDDDDLVSDHSALNDEDDIAAYDHRVLNDEELHFDGNDDDNDDIAYEPIELEVKTSQLPPAPLDLSSPPLPPKINRISSIPMPDVPHQVMHNRNRARSTSISEMSESHFNEFVNADADEDSSSKSGLDDNEGGSAIEKKSLITIDNTIPSAPVLPLSPRPPVSLWSVGRTSSFETDQSSYVSSSSSDRISVESRERDYLSIEIRGHDEDAEGQECIGVVEGRCSKQDSVCLSPVEGKSRNRMRTSSYASEQSSHVSAASSSSDHLFIDSREQAEDAEDKVYIDVPDRSANQETGHHSLQEGKCNIHPGDGSAEPSDPRVHRLTSETLREWNATCQEQYLPKMGVIKNRFVFRALSCPNKLTDAASPERGHIDRMDPGEEEDESVEEPHLMDVVSQSLFSYTNSGYSRAPSTISSQKKEDPEEVTSDLDFDMAFIYSYSIEKSSVSTALDGIERLSKSHKRSYSFSNEKSSVGTTPDGTDLLSRGHRRSWSSGSRLGKPIAAVLKHAAPSPQEDGGGGPASAKNKIPPTRGGRHRRFKSDGSILCKKRTTTVPFQVDFSLMEEPSFKSKYAGVQQHSRGRSLDFKSEPQIPDCPPLQSILEVLEEASKSSQSGDGLPNRASLRDFVLHHLEKMSATQVLKLGFLLGLVAGLLVPFVFAAIL